MSVLDTYNALMELREREDFPLAETMYLLDKDLDLDFDSATLQRLAQKTLDACYKCYEPLLHAERVEAVRSILVLGLHGQRAYPFPDLPDLSQEQMADLLLNLSENSFCILMETVAYNNQEYYCSEYSGTELWAQEVDRATAEIEAFLARVESLDSRIESAASKAQQGIPSKETPVLDR